MVRSPGRQAAAGDHQLTGKNNGPVIEALTGFADATTGGTSIRLNVTCGESTAESAR